MILNVKIKQFFRNMGITLDRYPTGVLRQRKMLMRHFGVNVIYDVGANVGQYGKIMRALGFRGKIISFEPLKEAFKHLEKKCSKDPLWIAWNFGIGSSNEEKMINVSKNSVSSSFQEMLPAHLDNSPDSCYVRKEQVSMKSFDSIFFEVHSESDVAMLKIDTQGYELNVLEGAKESLRKLSAIQLELSLSQTYANEPYFLTIIDFLDKCDFKLFSIEPGHFNKKSGQLYQADGIFFKKAFDQK